MYLPLFYLLLTLKVLQVLFKAYGTRTRRNEDSLLLRARRLLLFVVVLLVARLANFSSGLIFAVGPLTGRIRPALHARRPRGRGDVQPVLRVARAAHFISGLIFAVEPLNGCMRPAIHARRPRGVSMASTCEEYGTLTT